MPKPVHNHYEVLGAARTATPDEIRHAWHAFVLANHPERDGGDPARFRVGTNAYKVLKDPVARAAYDRALKRGKAFKPPTPLADIDVEAEVLAAFESLGDFRTAVQAGDRTAAVVSGLQFVGRLATTLLGLKQKRKVPQKPG